jgi:hypothetical protein
VPHRNRVTPYGEIIATEARGTMFGNRGILHDERGRLVRSWQVRRWIACRLEFRGRWRPLLRPNRYTGLFFLDEATALAAGHRPCAECRHEDFVRFRDLWPTGQGRPRADDIDRVLHAERVGPERGKRVHHVRVGDMPDGAMLDLDGAAWLLLDGELLEWSPFGYGARRRAVRTDRVALLTAPSMVEVIRRGYEPALHPSARSG